MTSGIPLTFRWYEFISMSSAFVPVTFFNEEKNNQKSPFSRSAAEDEWA